MQDDSPASSSYARSRRTLSAPTLTVRATGVMRVPPEKVYLCLQDYGNMGAPTVQMGLAKAVEDGRVRDGDLVALVAFGTGWNYGAAAIRHRDRNRGRG